MVKDKPRHYVEKAGRAYWQPSAAAKAHGFQGVALGVPGVAAKAKALEWNERWDRVRRGQEVGSRKVWPRHSLGEAFDRIQALDTWARKAPRTREEWHRAWSRISPIFGDVNPATVDLRTIDTFYSAMLSRHGVREAWRILKIWRAMWRLAGSLGYCDRDRDPSLDVRRMTPASRAFTWREGEVVRIVKAALRQGYPGLACVIAVAWDTQFSPGDVRALTPLQMRQDGDRTSFAIARAKTGEAALGTLSRRTERLIRDYLAAMSADLHPQAPIFRNRSGRAYSKDTLGDDFRDVRAIVMPGDPRTIGHDMRRSGTVEAFAGGAEASAVASKMANSIDQSRELQRTYNPVNKAAVNLADEARRRGRRAIRENG